MAKCETATERGTAHIIRISKNEKKKRKRIEETVA